MVQERDRLIELQKKYILEERVRNADGIAELERSSYIGDRLQAMGVKTDNEGRIRLLLGYFGIQVESSSDECIKGARDVARVLIENHEQELFDEDYEESLVHLLEDFSSHCDALLKYRQKAPEDPSIGSFFEWLGYSKEILDFVRELDKEK